MYVWCMKKVFDPAVTLRKGIELPRNKLKDLKILAAKAGMSFKAWIEHVILYQLK